MVMESLIWSFMVYIILCGLVWFSIVYYANVFPCKVSYMVLCGYVWYCMVLRSYAQFLSLFGNMTNFRKGYDSTIKRYGVIGRAGVLISGGTTF